MGVCARPDGRTAWPLAWSGRVGLARFPSPRKVVLASEAVAHALGPARVDVPAIAIRPPPRKPPGGRGAGPESDPGGRVWQGEGHSDPRPAGCAPGASQVPHHASERAVLNCRVTRPSSRPRGEPGVILRWVALARHARPRRSHRLSNRATERGTAPIPITPASTARSTALSTAPPRRRRDHPAMPTALARPRGVWGCWINRPLLHQALAVIRTQFPLYRTGATPMSLSATLRRTIFFARYLVGGPRRADCVSKVVAG